MKPHAARQSFQGAMRWLAIVLFVVVLTVVLVATFRYTRIQTEQHLNEQQVQLMMDRFAILSNEYYKTVQIIQEGNAAEAQAALTGLQALGQATPLGQQPIAIDIRIEETWFALPISARREVTSPYLETAGDYMVADMYEQLAAACDAVAESRHDRAAKQYRRFFALQRDLTASLLAFEDSKSEYRKRDEAQRALSDAHELERMNGEPDSYSSYGFMLVDTVDIILAHGESTTGGGYEGYTTAYADVFNHDLDLVWENCAALNDYEPQV